MGIDVTPEQEAALIASAMSRPGSVIGRSLAEVLAGVPAGSTPAAAVEAPPPAADCDEVGEFMPRVVALAKAGGWLVYHVPDSRRSEEGFLDLECVRPPRLLKIELKSEEGKLTAAQKKWLNAYRRCDGVEAHVFWPSDWAKIKELLR